MDTAEFFERYAAVVAAVGLSVQPDQEVYVRAPIEAVDFVPHFVRAAYRRGAKYVHTDYRHQAATRARLEEAPVDSLAFVPPGATTERLRIARDGGASLAVLGEDPTGLAGIDAKRKAVATKALAEASHEIRELA
ncbi:MAG: aminopeptidase, partial [Spirochaetota bacterium]